MTTIIEFPSSLSQVGLSISAAERDELIDFLAREPDAGDEIPGTGGQEDEMGSVISKSIERRM